jgi:hypothetical protein
MRPGVQFFFSRWEPLRQASVVMAFAVPAIAWIEESALILVLAAADFISWISWRARFLVAWSLKDRCTKTSERLVSRRCARFAQTAPLKKEGRNGW